MWEPRRLTTLWALTAYYTHSFTFLYFSILLHCTDLTLELLCRLCGTSFTILSSYSFTGRYTFRPNWPSSGVEVVMIKDSAAL
jgi:hypothetical protein